VKKRIQAIDGLRGVCILLVVLFHYSYVYPTKLGTGEAVLFQLPWGGVGVSIFFVVSGLVIMKSLVASTPLQFAISRFARLYPAYLVCLTITTAALYLWGDWYRSISIAQYWTNATMMQYYLGFRNVDGVYWSLRVEIVFYVLSALMFFGLKGKAFWWALLLFAVIAFLGNSVNLRYDLPAAVLIVPKVFVFEFIHYFLIGVVCCKLFFDHGRDCHSSRSGRIMVAIAAISFLDLLVNKPTYKFAAVSLAVAVLAIAAKRPGSAVSLMICSGPIQYLGKISYSLYLLHQVIGYLILRILQQAGMDLSLAILCTLGMVIILTDLVHRLVEVGFSNRLRLWLSTKLVIV